MNKMIILVWSVVLISAVSAMPQEERLVPMPIDGFEFMVFETGSGNFQAWMADGTHCVIHAFKGYTFEHGWTVSTDPAGYMYRCH